MILIVSRTDDPHADYVERQLGAVGSDFCRVDTDSTVSLTLDADEVVSSLGAVDLQEVCGVWYRRPSVPTPDVATSSRYYAGSELRALFLEALAATTSRWLPASPFVIRQADRKPLQLQAAKRLGLAIPPTLITNDGRRALDFLRSHDCSVISKLPSSNAVDAGEPRVFRYTERLGVHQAASLRADLRHCPAMFQALVPKRLELRVTVVGEEVFAAAIDSQTGARTRTDWRRYGVPNAYRPYDLPHKVAEHCRALVRDFGLSFGAIDLILTPQGEYVFLELNPNGQWLWVEKLSGLPIGAAVARALRSFQEQRH